MKLSIITVNLNNAAGLEKTISSVVSQTFKDFEFIIIDGKSTDGSLELIKKNEEKVSYWVSEPDSGIYSAMNKGIRAASGAYCLFLNSGDYLFNKTTLANIIPQFNDNDIISGAVLTYSDSNSIKELLKGINDTNMTFGKFVSSGLRHQATFIKKELFDRLGLYEENYKISADSIFLMNALVWGNASYKYINKIISHYNFDGLSTQSFLKNEKSDFDTKLRTMLPARIISDYDTGYFEMVRNIQKYPLSNFVLRILNRSVKAYQKSNWCKKREMKRYLDNSNEVR